MMFKVTHLAGNLFHDARTAILMREHGIRQICTRNTDFNSRSRKSSIRCDFSDPASRNRLKRARLRLGRDTIR